MTAKFPYEDIVHLPPHQSKKYPQPTMMDRAARFAPFAAITGYEEMVVEEARVTEERIELDESRKADLNEKLNRILNRVEENPEVQFVYFEPDKNKSGGAYVKRTGVVKGIDVRERIVILTDGGKISLDDIYEIECELVL